MIIFTERNKGRTERYHSNNVRVGHGADAECGPIRVLLHREHALRVYDHRRYTSNTVPATEPLFSVHER
jgi:hypothetical protein